MADSESETIAKLTAEIEPLDGEKKRGRGRPPGSPNKPKTADKTPEYKDRSDDEWRESVAQAWIGLFTILSLIGKLFGFVAEKLTPAEAMEDAVHLTPLVRKYPGLAKAFSWLGAPIVILNRISQKFKRKAKVANDNAAKENPTSSVRPVSAA